MNDLPKIIANILRISREKFWTQAKLARELGITKQAVTNWKNGDNSISQDVIDRAVQVLGVSEEELRGYNLKQNLTSVGSQPNWEGVAKKMEEMADFWKSRYEELKKELDKRSEGRK